MLKALPYLHYLRNNYPSNSNLKYLVGVCYAEAEIVNPKSIDLLKSDKLENEKFSNQFLPISLHTADLGNLCKEIKFYNEWVDRLMNEFFNQGDKERKLGIKPISFLCDRFKVNIHSGQVGFINFVIRPWFNKFGRLLYEDTHNKLFLNLLNENLKYMQQRANQTKDAQEEIEKNNNNNNNIITTNDDNQDNEEEEYDKVPPLPSKPIIYSIDNNDIINSRTSKSFSIVAMSFPEMRLKLLDWEKEKEKE